jgi:hypothetical protein
MKWICARPIILRTTTFPPRFTFTYQNIYKNTPFFVIPTDNHLQPVNIYFHISVIDEEIFHISASSDEASIMNFSDERIVSSNQKLQFKGDL